jgi:hypothetical protein
MVGLYECTTPVQPEWTAAQHSKRRNIDAIKHQDDSPQGARSPGQRQVSEPGLTATQQAYQGREARDPAQSSCCPQPTPCTQGESTGQDRLGKLSGQQQGGWEAFLAGKGGWEANCWRSKLPTQQARYGAAQQKRALPDPTTLQLTNNSLG